MTDVSISNGTYTFVFENGEIDKITESITSEPDSSPMPTQGSSNTFIYDYSGVTKKLNMNGQLFLTTSTRISGYDIKTISEQKKWLESLETGMQTAYTFTSNYFGESTDSEVAATPPYLMGFSTTTVFIESIKFDEECANPEQLSFDMSLIVGR